MELEDKTAAGLLTVRRASTICRSLQFRGTHRFISSINFSGTYPLFLIVTMLVFVETAAGWCKVFQPEELRAYTGAPLTLNCTFQVSENMSNIRVNWRHSNASLTDNVQVSSSIVDNINRRVSEHRKEMVSHDFGRNWSRLILSNVTLNNQGMYFCKVTVEIPTLENCSGNGTRVIIETLPAATEGAGWKIWIGVGLGTFLLTSMMLGLFLYCWKKKPKDATYANIPRPRRPFSQAQSHRQVPDCRQNRGTCLKPCQGKPCQGKPYRGKPCQARSPKSLDILTELGRQKPVNTNSLKA